MAANVSITLQATEEGRAIVDAIRTDNPNAIINAYPAMVKVDCPDELVINRESVEQNLGRDWNVQEIHLTLISLGGNIREDDDRFVLDWKR